MGQFPAVPHKHRQIRATRVPAIGNNMHFIGDIHGDFQTYKRLIEGLNCSIQLGDMGLGFRHDFTQRKEINYDGIPGQHMFIRGNHDNPEVCRSYKANYLGDYGYCKSNGLFYVSGAQTPAFDLWHRTEGISFWKDEQLSFSQLGSAIELFKDVKPSVVVTHDCPMDLLKYLIDTVRFGPIEVSRTTMALQEMFEAWQPDHWIFAHHHKVFSEKINGTQFTCVPTNGVFQLEGMTWDIPLSRV